MDVEMDVEMDVISEDHKEASVKDSVGAGSTVYSEEEKASLQASIAEPDHDGSDSDDEEVEV